MSRPTKVFGIGFHKTGTTSLAVALYVLGYNVTGVFGTHGPCIEKRICSAAFDLADRFDAAQDTPWPVLYKELDRRYPGSKFILTVRPAEQWIKSVVRHFKFYDIPIHAWIYGEGRALGNEDLYIQRYQVHNQEVREYFENRPNDLLEMDITSGDGWEKLCPFLGLEAPPVRFPTQNVSTERSRMAIRRGISYVGRTLFPSNSRYIDSQIHPGVSSAFLRDIVHYYCSTLDIVMQSATQISSEQFAQSLDLVDGSISTILNDQIVEAEFWLERLQPVGYAAPLSVDMGKCEIRRHMQLVHTKLRYYVATLTDESCNRWSPDGNAYVWEILTHLMSQGTKQSARLTIALAQFGVSLETSPFLSFCRPEMETRCPQNLASVSASRKIKD